MNSLLVGLILSTVVLVADDHSVNFDAHTDFSTLKTFAMREAPRARRELT